MSTPSDKPSSSPAPALPDHTDRVPQVHHTSHVRLFLIFAASLAVVIAATIGVRALLVKHDSPAGMPAGLQRSAERTTPGNRAQYGTWTTVAHRCAESSNGKGPRFLSRRAHEAGGNFGRGDATPRTPSTNGDPGRSTTDPGGATRAGLSPVPGERQRRRILLHLSSLGREGEGRAGCDVDRPPWW